MRTSKGFTLIELMIVIAIIAVIAAIAIPGLLQAQRASNERNAATSLKTLASAEADFRSNDRDGNKVNDFWTGDVAGLYSVSNWVDVGGAASGSTPPPIKLIELSVAGADANVLGTGNGNYNDITNFTNQSPKAGYWYYALGDDLAANGSPQYAQDTNGVDDSGSDEGAVECLNTSRFGFGTHPDSLSAGKSVFIINEGNTVFRQQLAVEVRGSGNPPGLPSNPTGGGQILDYPSDDQLKSFWSKLD